MSVNLVQALRAAPLADVPKLIGLGGGDVDRFLRFGFGCLAADDAETAEAAGHLATALDPTSALAWLVLGTAQARSRKANLAVESLRRATELNPKSVEGWLHLGEAHLALFDFVAAARALEHAIKLDPKATTPQGLRAQMLVIEILSTAEGEG